MAARPAYGELSRWLGEVPKGRARSRRRAFRRIGITFAVYGEAEAQERLVPFDVIPRIMAAPRRCAARSVHVDQAQRQAQM